MLGKFGGKIDGYDRWLGSQVTCALNPFKGIFHLVNYNTFIWSCNFKANEEYEFAKIFDAKNLVNKMFNIFNLCQAIASKYYIINIYHKYCKWIGILFEVEGVVYLWLFVSRIE